jgi:chromosome segregation ATPase
LAQLISVLKDKKAEQQEASRELQSVELKISEKKSMNSEALKNEFVERVFDQISKHCEPSMNEEVHKALRAVLANAWNVIVVDKMETADECLKYSFKRFQNFQGFLPRDGVERKQPINLEPLGNIPQFPIQDILTETDPPEIRDFILSCPFLRNVVFTDTLEHAFMLIANPTTARRLKIVTKEGAIVDSSGVELGAWNLVDYLSSKDLLASQIELQTNVDGLKDSMKFLEITKDVLKKDISKLGIDVGKFGEEKKTVDKNVKTLQDALKNCREQCEVSLRHISKIPFKFQIKN